MFLSDREPQIIDYINTAIKDNFMLWILVTSGAQGRLKSMGFDYGVGKSTFALQFMKATCYAGNFEKCKANTIGAYWQIRNILDSVTPPDFINAVYVDELELTLGKDKQHDPEIKELAYYMKTVRPYVRVWIASAPSRDTIQKDFREMFHFEIVIVKRGLYEVQQLKKWLDFKKPMTPKVTLRYSSEFSFFDLLPQEKQWYEAWRHNMNVTIRRKLKAFGGQQVGELKLENLSVLEARIVKRLEEKGYVRYETFHKEQMAHVAQRLKRKGWLELDGGRRFVLTELAEDVVYAKEAD